MTQTALLIQSYLPDHYDHVVKLLVESGWSGQAVPSARTIACHMQYGAAFVALSSDPAQPVIGFIRALSDGQTVSYISELVTADGWRNQGVGRSLVAALASMFPDCRIDVLSTVQGEAFYGQVGFNPRPGYRSWA